MNNAKYKTEGSMIKGQPGEAPPLGIKPEYLYNEHENIKRIAEIVTAMKSYSEADMDIPNDWIDELSNRMPLLCGA